MNGVNILSKDHFAAYQKIVSDYKLLLICENELANYLGKKKNQFVVGVENKMIVLLKQIILNKKILTENTKADEDYLQTLTTLI